jgi:hypothetical protein
MPSWRDDQRFMCPDCGRPIFLTELEQPGQPSAGCELIAICIDCQHVFRGDEWRKRKVVRETGREGGSPAPG